MPRNRLICLRAATIAISLLGASTLAPAGQVLDAVQPTIHEELAAHTGHFEKKVHEIDGFIYSAVGWSLGNTIMIVGDDGVIIVDTGTNAEGGLEARAALREITDKPVKAVIYTHFHPDHWGGVKAWTTPQEVASGEVQIISHSALLSNVIRQGGTIGPILSMRTGYSFGLFLPPEDVAGMNGGIGPRETGGGIAGFIAPTTTFDQTLELTIAGIRMQLQWIPSEAPDEISVYLPDSGNLLSGEAIQGPTLPNIHTLRGTKFRDPVQWYQSIDLLRQYGARNLIPSHGQPVYGAEKVEEVLRMTRDGIQFVHDQTIRHMNRGLTPDELAEVVVFPPHLRDYSPYLREYYGTVKHAVRQIYTGYLGWFSGDPVDLDPTPFVEKARRHVDLMGGRDRVLAEAGKSLAAGDPQWCAELATYLIRIDQDDTDARLLKAAAYRQMGYASMNINWRNWYLASAMELEGKVDPRPMLARLAQVFSSPDIAAQWPASRLVSGMSVRLNAERTGSTRSIGGFAISDTGEQMALEIRNGVAQFHQQIPADADFTVTLDKRALIALTNGMIPLAKAIESGAVEIEGNAQTAALFFDSFDSPLQEIRLSTR